MVAEADADGDCAPGKCDGGEPVCCAHALDEDVGGDFEEDVADEEDQD